MKTINKVFIDDLPKHPMGNINWKNCIGYKVDFEYDEIKGTVEIVDYENSHLLIKYLDADNFKILTDSFKSCKLGLLLNKYTSDFKIKIGETFKDDKRDITVTNNEYMPTYKDNGEIRQNFKWYKYTCNRCGWTEGWISEGDLTTNERGCSCCYGRTVVEGINDIPTTAPWMIPYFQGGYDEAKMYTKSSNQFINFICPDCNTVKPNKIRISKLHTNHSIGCSCSDGFSYPEKFMFNMLSQLNVCFQTQLNKSDYIWCENFKYDFGVEHMKTIIETDGGFHTNDNKMSGQSKEESKAIDDIKDSLAHNNGYRVIRIDCENSELEYIKDNIINSELKNLFDLSQIDWMECHEFALSNLIKQICEYKRNNISLSVNDLSQIFKLGKTTILNYLKQGNKVNWCHYNAREENVKSGIKSGKLNGKRVEVFKDGISRGVFESYADLDRQSKELFGVRMDRKNVSNVCKGTLKQYKGFYFKSK